MQHLLLFTMLLFSTPLLACKGETQKVKLDGNLVIEASAQSKLQIESRGVPKFGPQDKVKLITRIENNVLYLSLDPQEYPKLPVEFELTIGDGYSFRKVQFKFSGPIQKGGCGEVKVIRPPL